MSLSRYEVEVAAIAEGFGEIIEAHYKAAAYEVANELGEQLFRMTGEEYQKASKFLSQTPSQHEKVLNRLDDVEAATLLLRARYLGLVASRAIGLADDLQFIPGKGYRAAAAAAADRALRARIFPSLRSVLPGWEPGAQPPRHGW